MCESFNSVWSRVQAIDIFSGNKGEVITLIRHIFEDQNLIFNAQIIELIRIIQIWAKQYPFN